MVQNAKILAVRKPTPYLGPIFAALTKRRLAHTAHALAQDPECALYSICHFTLWVLFTVREYMLFSQYTTLDHTV